MAISADSPIVALDIDSQARLVNRARRNDFIFAGMGLAILFVVMAFLVALIADLSTTDWAGSTTPS